VQILLRAHKNPFKVAGPYRTLSGDLMGGNAGNLLFSQAAYRLLSTSDARIDTHKLIGLDPGHINESYDQVVVPLANAFRPSFTNELRAMTDLFSRLTIPVVVIGVGAQGPVSGKIAPSALDEVVKDFTASVLDHSASMGVRGEVTAAYLKRLGFGPSMVDVTGCCSMFMDGPHLEVVPKTQELTRDSRVSFNVSPYVSQMAQVALDHAERYPNLVYTAQDRFTLALMLTGTYDARAPHPAGSPTSMEHPLFKQNRVRFCLDPAMWIAHLEHFDFSFGTRIHGNIAALLSRVPAVVLAHDSRTLELAEYHAIPYRVLSKSEGVDAAQLYTGADWAPMLAGHAERWDRMTAFLVQNGLRHVYMDGESPEPFDRRLAATRFPRPIQVGGTWLTRRETSALRLAAKAKAVLSIGKSGGTISSSP